MIIKQDTCYKPVSITFETVSEFAAFTNIIDHADDDCVQHPLTDDGRKMLIEISDWITERFGLR